MLLAQNYEELVSLKLWLEEKLLNKKLLEMCYFHFQTGLEHH